MTIPTTDKARSLAFYEVLGFELRADFPWGDGYRWIEVYPPGTSTRLALIPAGPDPVGVRTGIILNTNDIDAAHAQMKALGVDVDSDIAAWDQLPRFASALLSRLNHSRPCSGFATPMETSCSSCSHIAHGKRSRHTGHRD